MNNNKNKRILIVEDEAIVAEDIKRSVISFGFEVIALLDTGEEAVTIARSEKPDLVIFDINIKGYVDGIDAAIKLKENNIPVIFLTAFGDKDTVERAKKAEPYGFLHKPFNERELRSAIELAIYKHGTENELKTKNKELERFNKLVVDREMRMIELKEEIARLKKKLEEK